MKGLVCISSKSIQRMGLNVINYDIAKLRNLTSKEFTFSLFVERALGTPGAEMTRKAGIAHWTG